MKKLFILLGLVLLVSCGGSGSNSSTSTTSKGGISFAVVGSKKSTTSNATTPFAKSKSLATTTSDSGTSFNFGDIKSTEIYLFQITNTGTAEVDNITLSTDNPTAAVCTPSSIAVLPIAGSGNGITPLVEVQVLHGVGLNGYGSAATLPAGSFTFNLTASGTDINGNTVSANCSIQLNVLVASFKLLDYASNEVVFGVRNNAWAYGAILPNPANGWYTLNTYAPTDNNNQRFYYIQNMGNVDLNINDLGSCDSTQTPINQNVTASAGVTTLITMQYTAGLNYYDYFKINDPIIINSDNTVFNSSLPTDPDGNFYLFYQYSENQ
jgi:hypothetical protein